MASTILIVDDSATILMSMEAILSKGGFVVTKASSSEEAFAKLQGGGAKPALIITDIHMKQMNGIELIRKVRALPGFQFTPILVVTTELQQQKRDEARAAKATGWLVKPVQPDDLMKVVKQILPQG